MTRFDAAEPTDRRALFVDALLAHRQRASEFLTLEVDEKTLETADVDVDLGVPWLQFADGVVNLDCTEAELDRLKSMLTEFPAFKINEITRPDDAEGINIRISAKADSNRIAQFFDAVIQTVYGLPDDSKVWVANI